MSSFHNNNSQFHQNHDENDHKRYSDRTNESQFKRFSDLTIEEFQHEENLSPQNLPLINKLISRKSSLEQILNDQNKKAINWLITFCWTQNYSLQTLWNSIGYYNAYIITKTVNKGKLTVLLLTLVNLSLKLFEPEKILKFEEMKRILGKDLDKQIFNQTENQVLELFEYELFFQNNLAIICLLSESEEQKEKVLFLCQILFLQTFEPAISRSYLRQVFELIHEPSIENEASMEIRRLSKEQKYIKNIKLKYSSIFDVDEYWSQIIE